MRGSRALLVLLATGLASCDTPERPRGDTGSQRTGVAERPPTASNAAGPAALPRAAAMSEAGGTRGVSSGVAARWDGRHPDAATWTDHLRKELLSSEAGARLLAASPSDAARFCSRYASLDREERAAVWVYLISGIAQFESNFKPGLAYKEAFPDRPGGSPVVSRGLLQISIASANQPRYSCGFRDARELHDPRRNLTCGVRILGVWVPQDGAIGGSRADGGPAGGARYWSTLRPGGRRQPLETIQSQTSDLPVCRSG